MQWENLKKEFRSVEGEVEEKLLRYSKSGGSQNFQQSQSLEYEIEGALKNLTRIVDELQDFVDRQPQNPSMKHSMQRHRDLLNNFSREYRKVKGNIAHAKDQAELLGSVRDDINHFHSTQTEMLLNERRRVDNVNSAADSVIDTAINARSSLYNQRTTLSSTSQRMNNAVSRIPGIDSLIARIKQRRRRDSLIMGAVIGICLFFIILYKLS